LFATLGTNKYIKLLSSVVFDFTVRPYTMAFARAVAASKSVKSLVLVSRSGRLDPTIAREMESHGCEVGRCNSKAVLIAHGLMVSALETKWRYAHHHCFL
jgi:hypothetical protein